MPVETSLDNLRITFSIDGLKKEVEFENIPSDILINLVKRTLSVFLQHKYRKGIGEYGILTVMNTKLKFKEIGD